MAAIGWKNMARGNRGLRMRRRQAQKMIQTLAKIRHGTAEHGANTCKHVSVDLLSDTSISSASTSNNQNCANDGLTHEGFVSRTEAFEKLVGAKTQQAENAGEEPLVGNILVEALRVEPRSGLQAVSPL